MMSSLRVVGGLGQKMTIDDKGWRGDHQKMMDDGGQIMIFDDKGVGPNTPQIDDIISEWPLKNYAQTLIQDKDFESGFAQFVSLDIFPQINELINYADIL